MLGYKLREHIGVAIKTRSHTIKKALESYNTAAMALRPPADQLTWAQVVEYVFLVDFDLLRLVRQDVQEKLWAKPGNWTLCDTFFKMERAREEIQRLNIEIRRVIMYMCDNELYLEKQEKAAKDKNPELAHQIFLYKMERARVKSLHMSRFQRLSVEPGFIGDVIPGYADVTTEAAPPGSLDPASMDSESDSDEDDIEDITYKVLSVSLDDWYVFFLFMQIYDWCTYSYRFLGAHLSHLRVGGIQWWLMMTWQ